MCFFKLLSAFYFCNLNIIGNEGQGHPQSILWVEIKVWWWFNLIFAYVTWNHCANSIAQFIRNKCLSSMHQSYNRRNPIGNYVTWNFKCIITYIRMGANYSLLYHLLIKMWFLIHHPTHSYSGSSVFESVFNSASSGREISFSYTITLDKNWETEETHFTLKAIKVYLYPEIVICIILPF